MALLGAPYLIIKAILAGASPPCLFELTPQGLNLQFPGFFPNKNSYTFAGPSAHATPDGGRHATDLCLVLCPQPPGNSVCTRVAFPRGTLVSHHAPSTYNSATGVLGHSLRLELLQRPKKSAAGAPLVSVWKASRVYERTLDLSIEADRAALEAWERGVGAQGGGGGSASGGSGGSGSGRAEGGAGSRDSTASAAAASKP
jgi:hypothetical protein